ncbi:MAG: uroporphyrinogen decarboxylase family protein, partial [Armatimonadota bacterium]|nr:uroporphyrinogen decarboxylase family protein [Armatimonadota bacterium]
MACRGGVTEEEYEEFGRPYDLRVLDAASSSDIVILHAHGEGVYFDLLSAYPVHAINWHDRRTPPSLREARARFSGCLVGGIDEVIFAGRAPAEVAQEVDEAIAQTGGTGHIVSAGCVVPIDAPEANIEAALSAARRV